MENSITLAPGARLTAVRLKNDNGQEIGNVVEWMMDVERGQVVYVLAAIEGSEDYFAIPWDLMKADPSRHGYLVDQHRIKNAGVTVSRDEMGALVDDRDFLPRLLKSYGIQAGEKESASPAGAAGERPRAPEETGPSNAYMSEGKGYGN